MGSHAAGIGVLVALTVLGLVVASGFGSATGLVTAPRFDTPQGLSVGEKIVTGSINTLSAGACTETKIHFYIVHLGPDKPEIAWTLQEKVAHTKQAFQDAQQIFADGLSAHGYENIALSAEYTVMVRHDAEVNIPGVNVIKIPEENLPKPDAPWGTCFNEYKLCFANKPLSEIYNMYSSYGPMDINIAFRNPAENPIGSFETNLKSPDTIPFVVLDGIKHFNAATSGWTNTEKGVIYLAYPVFWNKDLAMYDQALFSRTVAHELGHAFGVGHSDNPDLLMTAIGAGGTGKKFDVYQAARVRATICSPGLKPAVAGVVNKLSSGKEDTCRNDTLLHRKSGLMEECNPSFSGYFDGSAYLSKNITQFCPIIQINGTVLAQPLAVTDDPTHPNFFKTILQQYPGAVINRCTIKCGCEPIDSGGVFIESVLPPPGGGSGGGGGGKPPKSGGAQVPPTTHYCGDGILTGAEECDPPGEACGFYCIEGVMYVDTCNQNCQCVPAGTGGIGAPVGTCDIDNLG